MWLGGEGLVSVSKGEVEGKQLGWSEELSECCAALGVSQTLRMEGKVLKSKGQTTVNKKAPIH